MSDKPDTDANLFERFGRAYPAGSVLFAEGDPGSEMYVIQSGRVQLTRRVRGQDMAIAILPPGEFFGEMAIINGRPRSATATALDDARLLALDTRTFESMIRGNTEIALRLIKKLAARLAQANAQVEALLLKDASHRVVHHLRYLAHGQESADGPGVRIAITSKELAEQIDVERPEVDACLVRLAQARLLRVDGGSIYLAERGKLDQFLEFLELKERFGT